MGAGFISTHELSALHFLPEMGGFEKPFSLALGLRHLGGDGAINSGGEV